MFKIISKIIILIIGVAVSAIGIGYSMDLASSKSSFSFLGWVGFVLSIYLFWFVLTNITTFTSKPKKKSKDGPLPSSRKDEESENDPSSNLNRA